MTFSSFLLTEGIEPTKPLGKITKKKVVKNRGMINQKTLDQIEFNTTDGNNVKVQFKVEDGVGDVVFYVNDTLDDLGGRKDGSVDREILNGVLWIVDVYSDKMGLGGLTFSAWAGKGDTKVVRGLDVSKPLETAKKAVSEYLADVKGYDAKVIPPSENRIALAKKLGREPTVVYDVNVGKLSGILGEMLSDLESENMVRTHFFEEEVYLSRNVGGALPDNLFDMNPYVKLEELIPGAMEVLKAVKAYNVAKLSHTEDGASVTRNRRQDLYRRLFDKFFSGKWDIEQDRDTFTLTRKGVAAEATESIVMERKSLDMKREHILRWSEEALEGLRSGNFIACEHLKMPFGTFFGAKVVGKYANGLQNIYYFGTVDNPEQHGSATGRADLEDRKGTVWVKSYGVYDALEGSLRGIDGFQAHVSKLEGFDAGGVIFAFSEGEKKVLYHELSHMYDLMERGTRGVSSTEYRWSTRPEEIEAELNALYNAMLADSSLTLKDFEEKLTPDHYGIGSADGRYDTMVGPLYGWAERHPEKVKISHKKILRRWIDMRQMVMDKLSSRKVESRKFSDLMVEMPAWNDASKGLADDISGVDPVMDVVNNKEDGGFGMLDQFEIGEYVVWVMERGGGRALCCVVGYRGKVHVGEFDWYLNPFGWTTESAVVHPSHQGKGIAFGVYKYMIDNHMTTLYSDNHLTGEEGKGSFDIWAKLGRTFPYKYVYDSIEDIAEEVDGFTRDMMGDSDKLFVVSTEDILEDV